MRHDYGNTGWPGERPRRARPWQPGPRPAPYGEVPGQLSSSPRTPEPGPAHRPPAPYRSPWRGRKLVPAKGAVSRFVVLLVLLAALTGAGAGLRVAAGEPLFRLPDLFDGGLVPPTAEEDWTRQLPETSLARAETGDGTRLELEPEGETTLTARAIYDRVSPAVVGIRAARKEGTALGTGVIMAADGYIITNAHVIAGSFRVDVVLTDNKVRQALLVGYDGESDLAVLKIQGEDLPVAPFGDSGGLRVGDAAYAIGNPLGEELRGTMTEGIVSAIDRDVEVEGETMTLIQTTAAINPGNSGGALVNEFGQVVGITNMKMASMLEPIEGLGFAIPTAWAKPVVDQLIDQGSYAGRPLLGIRVTDSVDEVGEPDGARVASVQRDSDAYGKLWAADVIVEAAGEPVKCTSDLLRIKNRMAVGDELTLLVRLNLPHPEGEWPMKEVTVTLMSASDLADSTETKAERGFP